VSSNSQPSRRGRPRSDRARRAVLDAAAELAFEGASAAGVDAIASRAGVSRTTVYKWWPSAAAVLLEGLIDRTRDTIEASDAATTREALQEYLAKLTALVRDTPVGALLRGLIASAVSDPAVAYALIDDWLAPRRAAIVARLRDGERRGEVRPGLHYDTVADVLFAPVYHRLVFGHEPLTDHLAADILAISWPGIAAEQDTPTNDQRMRKQQ